MPFHSHIPFNDCLSDVKVFIQPFPVPEHARVGDKRKSQHDRWKSGASARATVCLRGAEWRPQKEMPQRKDTKPRRTDPYDP
jgi:hypothetical protein